MTRLNLRSRRSLGSTLASIADALAGARDCAAAVESGRRPSNRALEAVGISAEAWDRIGQR